MDIYGVHKALKFGQSQREEYLHSHFVKDVEKADRDFFEGDICTPFVFRNQQQFSLLFYPLYLVNDDVFDVMASHFAVSLVVNQMAKERENAAGLHIRSVVVPAALCSLYDVNNEFESTIFDIDRYIQGVSPSKLHVTLRMESSLSRIHEMADTIKGLICHIGSKSARNIAVIFNRRIRNEADSATVTVFECSDWAQMSELQRNYCISFDFVISTGDEHSESICENTDEMVVRCWLTFGVGQRLRFYPEYVVWVIPHLFVRSTTMSTYKFVKALYGEDYKHGWRVNLDDEVFNKYYHIITGHEHISNNYNRTAANIQMKYGDADCGLRDHLERTFGHMDSVHGLFKLSVEHLYDSDAILDDIFSENHRVDAGDSNIANIVGVRSVNLRALKFTILQFENMECKEESVQHIANCEHINEVIESLQIFQRCDDEIDALNVIDFDLDSIINGFDHMIKVHEFLSDDVKRLEIQNYINHHIRCEKAMDCEILMKHSNRARERANNEPKQNELLHKVDTLCELVSDALHSVHCYLLHRNDHLLRLLSDQNKKFQSRFATETKQADEEESDDRKVDDKEVRVPLGINFGLNVLQWLPYQVLPIHNTLKDEVIRNPESTIDRALFNHYEIICIAKLKNTNYTLKEMLCLKLYCDTTDLQAKLRRAHWTVASLAVRKAYYQWGRGLYETHLYHAAPIPAASGSVTKPCKLYHGLSQMFMMTHELPIYNGPFSTTIAKEVATTFCKEQGLIWMIQPTYSNPLRFCIGISMDWISAFQNEREVLLYNQFLPIQKTETFDDDIILFFNKLVAWPLICGFTVLAF